MHFWVRPWIQTRKPSLEAKTIERKTIKIKSQKSYWSLYSIWEALSTAKSCQKAIQSISNSTRPSCGVCFAQCVWKDVSCGRKSRSCIIMHQLTTPCIIRQFLAERNIAVLEQPHCLPDLALNNFWFFSSAERIIKGTRFKTRRPWTGPYRQSWEDISERHFEDFIEAWLEGDYHEEEPCILLLEFK